MSSFNRENYEKRSFIVGVAGGMEYSFPKAFMGLLDCFSGKIHDDEKKITYNFQSEFVSVDPFDLTYKPKYHLVLDRCSHWRTIVLEWLKKITLDRVYVINNPMTFDGMKKNFGYAALAKLGFQVPKTIMLPPRDNEGIPDHFLKKTNSMFDLEKIGDEMGYPLYMKPYNGGGWKNVTRCDNYFELITAYNRSGKLIMNLQKGIDYDHFIRCIVIGNQVMILRYLPENPLHRRYSVDLPDLSESVLEFIRKSCLIINGVHDFEMNSAEFLIRGKEIFPIDFNNPVPDLSLISLHRFFPTAIKNMVRQVIYSLISEKSYKYNPEVDSYLEIAESDLPFSEKLDCYYEITEEHFNFKEREEFNKKFINTDFLIVEEEFFQSDAFLDIFEEKLHRTFYKDNSPEEYEIFFNEYRKLLNL